MATSASGSFTSRAPAGSAEAAGVGASQGGGRRGGVALVPLRAVRAHPGPAAGLLTAAASAWWWTAERMEGMNAGPGTALGSIGWFTGVWVTMMAAMMLPSLAPAAAFLGASIRRGLGGVVLFAGGYLLIWALAGVGGYCVLELGGSLFAGSLAWHGGGRWLAAGVLALAAGYQLTPLKREFLSRCRSPRGLADGSRRDTRPGAFALGIRTGFWCLGCSWALMAALFALGVMSLTWMGLVAALVAMEKIAPWGRGVRLAGTGVLAVLAAGILAVPHEVPGFVVPGSPASVHVMKAMR